MEVYRRRFAHEGLDLDATDDQSDAYAVVIADQKPAYAEEMRGIADVSGVPLCEVTMFNVRWEVIYVAWKGRTADADGVRAGDRPGADGCTSLGVTPQAPRDGKTYVAQNWDWFVGLEDAIFLAEL